MPADVRIHAYRVGAGTAATERWRAPGWTVAALAALIACQGPNHVPDDVIANMSRPDPPLARLTQLLGEARTQSDSYLSGEALPARKDIAAIVDADPRPWWQSLTPDQTFLLFEASPETAARAPADVRVNAYCAGVETVSAEWWGTPGAPQTQLSQRVIALGAPAARCLARLFDDERRIFYKDGESQFESRQNQWTVADLAAGLAARALGESYDASAAPAERAARRDALRASMASAL
ncbi:MAG TPA: hypothetical protein VIX73_05530 [Kofleriaceae bacterium]